MTPLRDRAQSFFSDLQNRICTAIEQLDGKARFVEDRWSYEAGEGGGISRVIRDGALMEKGGVNLSAVTGKLSPRLAERLNVEPRAFFATGLSLVLHPESPMVPTVHMNARYLELPGERAWFGGGADLTPYYLFEEDARHFHRCFADVCAAHPVADYGKLKRWCDEYFFVKHRGEARGIGGIFFDYFDRDLEQVFAFVREVGNGFLDAYRPIVERRRGEPWTEEERRWQLIRRGRYVEFNLVHDRGTLFGLETGGRTESILISLPPLVRWEYDHRPQPGSREAELLEALHNPRDWLGRG